MGLGFNSSTCLKFLKTFSNVSKKFYSPGDLVNLENYCATLGHKINHNFVYNCTEWFFEHPRHGLIPCVITTEDVDEGQELYLHYGEKINKCQKNISF